LGVGQFHGILRSVGDDDCRRHQPNLSLNESADLKSPLGAQESSSAENARAVERINVHLGRFEQQSIALFDQLSNLKQMIDDHGPVELG
jgi:hypothetical protein